MPVENGAAYSRSPETAMQIDEVAPVYIINTCFGMAQQAPRAEPDEIREAADAAGHGLSVRAVNVLKMLADEIMGEVPPRDDWVPPNDLLRKITVERLSIARNCGPRTVEEIIRWAEARGVTIQPLFHSGKSLSETWRGLSARFSAGELTRAELAEALEKSVRRKSTKIPIAVQRILLKYLGRAGEDPRRG